jgi:hypothetical protein
MQMFSSQPPDQLLFGQSERADALRELLTDTNMKIKPRVYIKVNREESGVYIRKNILSFIDNTNWFVQNTHAARV